MRMEIQRFLQDLEILFLNENSNIQIRNDRMYWVRSSMEIGLIYYRFHCTSISHDITRATGGKYHRLSEFMRHLPNVFAEVLPDRSNLYFWSPLTDPSPDEPDHLLELRCDPDFAEFAFLWVHA